MPTQGAGAVTYHLMLQSRLKAQVPLWHFVESVQLAGVLQVRGGRKGFSCCWLSRGVKAGHDLQELGIDVSGVEVRGRWVLNRHSTVIWLKVKGKVALTKDQDPVNLQGCRSKGLGLLSSCAAPSLVSPL